MDEIPVTPDNPEAGGMKEENSPSPLPDTEKGGVRESCPPLLPGAGEPEEVPKDNPRTGRVFRLQEELEREAGFERQRGRRLRQQQEYIDRISLSADGSLRSRKEEQQNNEASEARIRMEIYRMHGISEDKLEGMAEYRNAWYQGAAFSLFFLSLVLFALCGFLHGFGSEICMFMAFYTAAEGALLSGTGRQDTAYEMLVRVLYLLLFPVMLMIFVCYELGFEEYRLLVPVLTVAGAVILLLGTAPYFLRDPYRQARRSRRKAEGYLREMEKVAGKELRLREKAVDRLEKKKEKQAAKAEKKARRERLRQEKREEKAAKKLAVRPEQEESRDPEGEKTGIN